MTLSRQEQSLTKSETGGRANQRARTRAALTRAAGELMREGQAPSMPDAAERALVSVATAYRYFPTAEELWEEAASFNVEDFVDFDAVGRSVQAAGEDVEARIEAVVRGIGWAMLDPDHELSFRQSAKTSLDRWFAQRRNDEAPRPTRPGQRNHWNSLAVEPLRGVLTDRQVDALVEALGLAWGTEAMISLLDVLRLDRDAAKNRMLTTCKWIIRAAIAEASTTVPRQRGTRRSE